MKSQRKGNRFVVDFEGAELPPGVAERIEVNVREAALLTIARLDFRGDVVLKLPPELRGIILRGDFGDIIDFPS